MNLQLPREFVLVRDFDTVIFFSFSDLTFFIKNNESMTLHVANFDRFGMTVVHSSPRLRKRDNIVEPSLFFCFFA